MFTGIVTDIGFVRSVDKNDQSRFQISTVYDTRRIAIGASICCSGVCLTVVAKGSDWFAVEVSDETLAKTTIPEWRVGSRVNLERSLKIGDELGGHIVLGHVDGVAQLADLQPHHGSVVMAFNAPEDLNKFVAIKGAITIDGVSLTVNKVIDSTFTVNVIPHTLQVTTMGEMKYGDAVNLEIDVLARYVSRLREMEG